MPYDALKDVVAVSVVAAQPVVLVVRADAPFKTLADVVSAAKAKPGEIKQALAGTGTLGHMAGEVLAKRAGFKVLNVPYKGAAPAITDLLGGQTNYMFATPQGALAMVKGGKLRALTVTSAKRLPVMPDVPTVGESYKGFEAVDWKAIVVPAGTPADIVKKLNAAIDKALAKPATIAQLQAEGSVPVGAVHQGGARALGRRGARCGCEARIRKKGFPGGGRYSSRPMDRLKQLESFVSVATRGGLTAAAKAEGVAPAIMGRRLDALEERLGVKLLVRTTLTHEGSAFLEDCQRLLTEFANAEASVSAGGIKASGHLRVTAPAGFGRRHVAPLVPRFHAMHPEVTISLNLSDRVVDVTGESFDCAVRVGDLPDSSLVSVRLADNRRRCVATPEFLRRHGTPKHPGELSRFACLTLSSDASQTRGWAFRITTEAGVQELIHLRPSGPLDCSDGQVLHDWCLAGHGIAWRSTWEVEAEIDVGLLVPLLDDFAALPNGIYAVFAGAKHLPLRVRLWLDFLKEQYGRPAFWGGRPEDA